MYHYTYLLQHKTTDMRYIGVRSSKLPPFEDDYYGSSRYIPKDVRKTHSKIILKVFKTREEAVQHEIKLHELNNVVKNTNYYNRAAQTSTRFDTTGTILTEEHKAKCSKALKNRVVSQETRDKISKAKLGVKKSPETVKKMSDYMLSQKLEGTKNYNFKPWFISYPTVTHLFYDITKRDKAIQDDIHPKQYVSLAAQYRKTGKPITRGIYKGVIVGDIPTNS